MNLQQQGSLRLQMKFKKALLKTVCVMVYAEFDNIIEITKNRQVLLDFPN